MTTHRISLLPLANCKTNHPKLEYTKSLLFMRLTKLYHHQQETNFISNYKNTVAKTKKNHTKTFLLLETSTQQQILRKNIAHSLKQMLSKTLTIITAMGYLTSAETTNDASATHGINKNQPEK